MDIVLIPGIVSGAFFIERSLKYWYIKNVASTKCF